MNIFICFHYVSMLFVIQLSKIVDISLVNKQISKTNEFELEILYIIFNMATSNVNSGNTVFKKCI